MCAVKGRRFIVLFGYKLNQFGLRKCPHNHWLTNKAYKQYHSNKNFLAFYLQSGGKKTVAIDMKQNYVTLTLTHYPGESVPETSNQSGLYWSKRQWVTTASAGPYASLRLTPDWQPCQNATIQMPFLPPNEQHQSTEGNYVTVTLCI